MSLTIKGIEAAKPRVDKATGGVKLVRLADGDGLFLEVTATSKRWRARYFFEGKEQMLSLGKYPVVGLKEARDKNFLLRQQLDQGINPALERKKEKERVKEAVQEEKRITKGEAHPLSLEAVALDWLEDVRKTWKPRTYKAERQRVVRNIIGTLGTLRIQDITPTDVRSVFQQLEADGKYDTLRKIAELTVRIFNFGIAVGKCENNPAYSIWKGLSFKRPDPNRGFATITSPEKVGKLLQTLDSTMTEKCGLEVATALRMAPYVFLRPAPDQRRVGGNRLGGAGMAYPWPEDEEQQAAHRAAGPASGRAAGKSAPLHGRRPLPLPLVGQRGTFDHQRPAQGHSRGRIPLRRVHGARLPAHGRDSAQGVGLCA